MRILALFVVLFVTATAHEAEELPDKKQILKLEDDSGPSTREARSGRFK